MNAVLLRVSFLQLVFAFALSAATHTLTININGSGTVSTNPTATAYPHNSTVTLTAVPALNWQFNGWSGDINGTLNPTNVLMDADKVIAANFSPIPTYTLTVNVTGGGSVSPNGGTYLSNSAVQLTATAANGWRFDHWAGDAGGNTNPIVVTMSSNKVVGAVFGEPPVITTEPADNIASIGGDVAFGVTATGTPPLSYTWYFNNAPIPGANSTELTLTNAQPGNAGNYFVIVTNAYGNATSRLAFLLVSCPGTNVVSVPSDAALRAAIAVGGNVQLCFNGTVVLTNTINVSKDTTVDASAVGVMISGNSALRLFNVNTGVTLVLSNLVLANGLHQGTNGLNAPAPLAARNGGSAAGGAIYNAGGVVRLVSCVLSNNYAKGGTGGHGDFSSSASRTNGIGGDALGGCIYSAGGTVILQGTVAIQNGALGGEGGNLADFGILFGNGGSASGGVVHNAGGAVYVSGGFFGSNVVQAASGTLPRPVASGACLFQSAGSLTGSNSTFAMNQAIGKPVWLVTRDLLREAAAHTPKAERWVCSEASLKSTPVISAPIRQLGDPLFATAVMARAWEEAFTIMAPCESLHRK